MPAAGASTAIRVEQQTAELERATPGEWEPAAAAVLAEAVAALLIE